MIVTFENDCSRRTHSNLQEALDLGRSMEYVIKNSQAFGTQPSSQLSGIQISLKPLY